MANQIEEMMQSAMLSIKTTVNVENVIGEPVTAPDGTIIVPVSSYSFGFGAGGADLSKVKMDGEQAFGGGCGGGASVKPIGFLVVNNGSVRYVSMEGSQTPIDRMIDTIPTMFDKVNGIVSNIKGKKKKSAITGPIVNE